MGKERKLHKVLMGKPEEKTPFERPRHKCEDGIRMGDGEIELGVCSGFSWLKIEAGGGLL
jgi:hypothetical protein